MSVAEWEWGGGTYHHVDGHEKVIRVDVDAGHVKLIKHLCLIMAATVVPSRRSQRKFVTYPV